MNQSHRSARIRARLSIVARAHSPSRLSLVPSWFRLLCASPPSSSKSRRSLSASSSWTSRLSASSCCWTSWSSRSPRVLRVLRRRGAGLSGLQRERERFEDSGSATTKVFLSFSLSVQCVCFSTRGSLSYQELPVAHEELSRCILAARGGLAGAGNSSRAQKIHEELTMYTFTHHYCR